MAIKTIADFAMDGLLTGEPDFRVLYKYQRITYYSLDALRNQYLYFSSFAQLNDPFDPFLTLLAGQSGDVGSAILCAGRRFFALPKSLFIRLCGHTMRIHTLACVSATPYSPVIRDCSIL